MTQKNGKFKKFYGRNLSGRWYYFNTYAGIVPFGFRKTLIHDDEVGNIDWYVFVFKKGKAILLPTYHNKKLIWIE